MKTMYIMFSGQKFLMAWVSHQSELYFLQSRSAMALFKYTDVIQDHQN